MGRKGHRLSRKNAFLTNYCEFLRSARLWAGGSVWLPSRPPRGRPRWGWEAGADCRRPRFGGCPARPCGPQGPSPAGAPGELRVRQMGGSAPWQAGRAPSPHLCPPRPGSQRRARGCRRSQRAACGPMSSGTSPIARGPPCETDRGVPQNLVAASISCGNSGGSIL